MLVHISALEKYEFHVNKSKASNNHVCLCLQSEAFYFKFLKCIEYKLNLQHFRKALRHFSLLLRCLIWIS